MKKKMIYLRPTVKITQVVLGKGMMSASPINPKGIKMSDWKPYDTQREYKGNSWLPS